MALSKTNAIPLWKPSNPEIAPIDIYRRRVNEKFGLRLQNAQELHKWSVTAPQDFWTDVYDFVGLIPALPPSVKRAYDDSVPLSDVPLWFEGASINFAENVLCNPAVDPSKVALIGLREGQDLEGEQLTWFELRERVRVVQSAMLRSGIKEGDIVAAIVSTSNWAVILLLASASIGAIFSCISPDLGVEGCISRLQQISPKILFADSDSTYKGRRTSVAPKVSQILENLSSPPETFLIPIASSPEPFPAVEEFLWRSSALDTLEFRPLSFNSPMIIVYSSGTTGTPKCIVHRQGMILNLRKTSILHNSMSPRDVVMQYSSTSWVVFYVVVGQLATGATCICYDGSPLWPDPMIMMRIVERHKVTYFGTSPRYLLELEQSQTIPRNAYNLSHLRMVYSTGSALGAEQYRWFYTAFPPSVQICNTAGGTEIATSLIAADPSGTVHLGEMQMLALGHDIDIVDPESGESIAHTGEAGEMVIRKPFPSMPVFFWGDKGNVIYRASYFEKFGKRVWAQHDWLQRNPATGGLTLSGRSDGVLNPSGIRFGSGEIYAISEGPLFNTTIAETLCVGRRRPHDTDEEVFLFVRMNTGHVFTPELATRLKQTIREGLSARHVPKYVEEVAQIPVTINGKKVEGAIKQIISGKSVKASATVANPESFELYKRFVGLEVMRPSKL
ncbi:acetoacetyl-CoA synthase [Eremomyces bilateralis CBS 781.70]|uniref:Acetoacetyl-CoA synthase n=1 Tax=Eremomyces bilateralis CBS 781.70 TaxID=1392243 RepID=A0A6G1G275_9PEZI|nr:acetoacetyl-CoA synthase [Eremomyces bilateralis CBS 781.70]KAF1812026.1 acetoacetyl-CoA synthase [Eremomyces bilateralis CBS 781.70]